MRHGVEVRHLRNWLQADSTGASALRPFVYLSLPISIESRGINLGWLSELGRRPVSGDLLKRAARSTMSSPVKMTSSLLKVTPEFLGAANTGIGNRKKEEKAGPVIPETRFNRLVSPHKVFGALNYPLNEFKQIKSLVDGAMINGVALAIVGGVLRS